MSWGKNANHSQLESLGVEHLRHKNRIKECHHLESFSIFPLMRSWNDFRMTTHAFGGTFQRMHAYAGPEAHSLFCVLLLWKILKNKLLLIHTIILPVKWLLNLMRLERESLIYNEPFLFSLKQIWKLSNYDVEMEEMQRRYCVIHRIILVSMLQRRWFH